MNKHNHWLSTQIPQWVTDNIITQQQAQRLQQLYPVKDSISLGRLLITGIGAIMIGLGVILLFAYNWADMDKFLKLAVIFSALTGAHVAAMLTLHRNAILGESLFALGTMLMGASIFLIGQIYHIDSHYPNAFLLWSVGALALAWALPSLTQAFMTILLVLTWHLTEVFDFHVSNHVAFMVIIIGLFPLVWRLNSPLLARFTSASLFISLGASIGSVDEGLIVITLLLMAATLINFDRIIQHRGINAQTLIADEIARPANLVLVVTLLLMTFRDLLPEIVHFKLDDTLTSGFFWIALLTSQSGFIWLAIKRQLSAMVALAELTVVLMLLPTLLVFFTEIKSLVNLYGWMMIGFNLILLASSIWLMIDGAKQANRGRMVKGSILFAVLAMARYTDLFDSLIARATVFLIVGIALFVIGNIYQRNKKGAKS